MPAEHVRGNIEFNLSTFASLEEHPPEAFELLDRTGFRRYDISDIELCHLISVIFARIADRNLGLDRSIHSHHSVGQCNGRILKGGITQAVTERIEWLVRAINPVAGISAIILAVCIPAGILHIVINRNLADAERECHGKFSRRIHISEKDVRDGISRLRTAEPGLQDGGHCLIFPGKRHRTAGEEHQDNRLSGPGQSFQQFLLAFRKAYVGTGTGFSAHIGGFSHCGNNNVRIPGGGHGLTDHFIQRTPVPSGGIPGRYHLFQSLIFKDIAALRISEADSIHPAHLVQQ